MGRLSRSSGEDPHGHDQGARHLSASMLMDAGELRSVARSLALAIALLAALTPASARAQMEWVGPLAPPGPVEVPAGGLVVEFPSDWEVRGVSQGAIVELAESSSLDPELWRPIVFGLNVRGDAFTFCLAAEGGGWGHANPTVELSDLAKVIRDDGHIVKKFDWPAGQAIKATTDLGKSIYMKEGLSWAQVACGGTSEVSDEIVDGIASSLRFTPVAQQQAPAPQPSGSGPSGDGSVGVLALLAVVFISVVAVMLYRGRGATPAVAMASSRSSRSRALAVDKPASTSSGGTVPSGEPRGEIVVESYPGRTQADAAVVFAKRAEFMAIRGYTPVSQSWSEGRPGVKRVVMLGVFANSIRPDGHLTVTYQRTIPAEASTAHAGTSTTTQGTTERARETDASRPSAPPTTEPEAAPAATRPVLAGGSQAEPERETKTCPDCAETILKEARICRFCRYEYWPADAPPPASAASKGPEATSSAPADPPATPEPVTDYDEIPPADEPPSGSQSPPVEPEAPSPEPQPATSWEPSAPQRQTQHRRLLRLRQLAVPRHRRRTHRNSLRRRPRRRGSHQRQGQPPQSQPPRQGPGAWGPPPRPPDRPRS